jgi:hypothetical protein
MAASPTPRQLQQQQRYGCVTVIMPITAAAAAAALWLRHCHHANNCNGAMAAMQTPHHSLQQHYGCVAGTARTTAAAAL